MFRSFLLFSLLLLSAKLSFAQFAFEADTTAAPSYQNTIQEALPAPDFDSVQFELRYWVSATWFAPVFVQLTYDRKGKWRARSGRITLQRELIIAEHQPDIALEKLWDELEKLEVLRLPAQRKAKLKNPDINAEQKHNFFGSMTECSYHTVELFNKNGYRAYSYNCPEEFLEKLERKGWNTEEHKKVVRVYRLLEGEFGFEELIEEQVNEK